MFFSDGPGDPAAAAVRVAAMRGVRDAGVLIFGIGFGSQIPVRAIGLDTYKLRYGDRGVNQPVMDLATGRLNITSHNHGFAAAPPPEADTSRTGDGLGARAAQAAPPPSRSAHRTARPG